MHFLSTLQKKTPGERRRYALLISGVITGIIALVWISTLSTRMQSLSVQTENKQIFEEAPMDVLAETKDQLGSAVTAYKNLEALDEEVRTEEMREFGEGVQTVYAPSLESLDIGDPSLNTEIVNGDVSATDAEATQDIHTKESDHGDTAFEPKASTGATPIVPSSKKVLIELDTTPPRPILIETTRTQETVQN